MVELDATEGRACQDTEEKLHRLFTDSNKLSVVTEIFRILGDPTRLKIFLSCLNEPKYVSDVAAKVGISSSLVSHHLRILRSAKLVRAERQGRQILYGGTDAHLKTMLEELVAHLHGIDEEGAGT